MATASNRRDRLIATSAAVVVVVLAASVVVTVLTAERNGRKALEDLQLAQMQQLGRVLDGALGPALTSKVGLTNPLTRQPWTLAPNDASDAAALNALQSSQPTARTGYVLVDASGVVVNGTLLQPGAIGSRVDRPGLSGVLAGNAAVLPTSDKSLTTPLPTIAIARPIRANGDGPVVGALLQESDVAADSQFTKLLAGFRRANTDEYSFLDVNGIVVASTNPTTVGHEAAPILLDPTAGFHRHGGDVTAIVDLPTIGWTAGYRQTTSEFEGNLTGPLRSALVLLTIAALIGGLLTFFALLSRLRAARREQARLAAINDAREEFISIVSHELRTPATGQLGFLQTLLDHWEDLDDNRRRETVRQAYANARRLHALSRDVLDTASVEAGELPYAFEVVDLRAAAQSAIDAIPNPDHELAIDGVDALPVRADPERIQQVLANLLDNAMKNSPSGTRIDVVLDVSGDDARVRVSDRGAGLTEDELGRVFEKFSRGRYTTVTGTGLGLYICRMIIDAHGGRIWAETRDGGGMTVTFTLARVSDAADGDGTDTDEVPLAGTATP